MSNPHIGAIAIMKHNDTHIHTSQNSTTAIKTIIKATPGDHSYILIFNSHYHHIL